MKIKIEIILANLLIGVGSAITLLWLFLAALSFHGADSGLAPWSAAGLLMYGYMIVIVASIISFIGIVWAGQTSNIVAPQWKAFTLVPIKVGFVIMAIGLACSIAVQFFI